jgi:hypothetical protein
MGAESFIKGRIAEALIEELLRTCGNKVYRFGYESILQNLIQTNSAFDRHTRNGEQIRSIPDFFVLNGHGKSFFVEVKFRADPRRLVDMKLLKALKTYWQPKLILVTIAEPYFRVVDPQFLFDEDYSSEPLETDPDLNVTRHALKEFDPLVVRFLANGQSHQRINRSSESQQQRPER